MALSGFIRSSSFNRKKRHMYFVLGVLLLLSSYHFINIIILSLTHVTRIEDLQEHTETVVRRCCVKKVF